VTVSEVSERFCTAAHNPGNEGKCLTADCIFGTEWGASEVFIMPEQPLKITGTDRLGEYMVVVEYSDNSIAVYSVEQLSTLTPTKFSNVDLDKPE